ncbi:hypothetical protein D3C72_1211220 [compost metagenome]
MLVDGLPCNRLPPLTVISVETKRRDFTQANEPYVRLTSAMVEGIFMLASLGLLPRTILRSTSPAASMKPSLDRVSPNGVIWSSLPMPAISNQSSTEDFLSSSASSRISSMSALMKSLMVSSGRSFFSPNSRTRAMVSPISAPTFFFSSDMGCSLRVSQPPGQEWQLAVGVWE